MRVVKMNQTNAWTKKNEKDWEDTSNTRPHAMNVDWLMNDHDAAIQLHLSNMVATYGYEAVRKGLDGVKIGIKKVG